jgi:uncharacterized protein
MLKALILSSLLISFFIQAKEVPRHTGPVMDQAGLLSSQESKALTAALYNFKQQYGPEIQLLTMNSLEGDSLEDFSIRVVDKWKIGNKKRDDGVLFLISVKDRKMRIEVGQGLEGDLTDAEAGRITRAVGKHFKANDYRSGVILGLSMIAEQAGGKLTGSPRVRVKRARKGSLFNTFFLLIFFALSFGRRRRGGFLTGMLLGGMAGSSRSGFGGGGSFGGGGGFSGGGSSGSW